MRRLAYAAFCSSLVLAAACTDTQAPTEPAPPQPEEHLGTCRPVRFPILNVTNQIRNVVFKTAAPKVRLEAVLRAGAVALLWNTCHPIAARRVAVDFVNWIDRNAPPSVPAAQVTTLKVTILNGVGIPVTVPTGGSPDDFGVGTFDPANPNKTLIKTNNSCALIQLDPLSFTEFTVISLRRLADDFALTGFEGRQFAPKYDFSAFNASNDPVLKNGKKAIVAFNLLSMGDTDVPGSGYPAGLRIGHNPSTGGFEILEEADLDFENLDDDLALCEDPTRIGSFGSAPTGFANAALRTAGQIFLPQPLWANAFGPRIPPPPPLGGKAGGLSPFAPVEVSSNQIEPFGSTIDPEDGNAVGVPLNTCSNDGCPLQFRVTDGEVPVPTSSTLTVSLIQPTGSAAILSGTKVKSTSTEAPYTAVFDDLTISEPGTYQLMVTSPGAASHTTGVFTVAPAVDNPLVLNVTTVEKLPGGTQHFVVQSGSPGPYIWSVNGVDGGNATYGMIVTNPDFTADYTAPASVPSTPTFDVCARREASPLNTACASVTIQPVPSSGADIIVFNDLNMLDNTAASDPNNIQLFKNLVNFTATGSHASGNSVLIHQGHASRCGTGAACGGFWTSFVSTLTGDGYTVINGSDETTPLTSIGADIKVILLALPTKTVGSEGYSDAEINSLKAFAGAGGRIVFVGEHADFYGTDGIDVENAFLIAMGAEMRNTGGSVDCGYNVLPAASLRDHQVTAGLDQLTIACASVVDPGPNDYSLFYSLAGNQVLGAVAKIDLTPLSGLNVVTQGRMTRRSAPRLSTNVPADVEVFSWGFRPRE